MVKYLSHSCWLCLIFAVASVRCGGAGRAPLAAVEVPPSITSQHLYQIYREVTQAQRESYAAAVSVMSIKAYYALLIRAASPAAFAIDGQAFPAPAIMLRQRAAEFDDLAARFATMGDYWRSAGFDPRVAISQAAFTTAVSMVRKHWAPPRASAALDLVDLRIPPTVGCSVNETGYLAVVPDRNAVPIGALGIGLAPGIGDMPAVGDGPVTLQVHVPSDGDMQAKAWLAEFNAGLYDPTGSTHVLHYDSNGVRRFTNGSKGNYAKWASAPNEVSCRYVYEVGNGDRSTKGFRVTFDKQTGKVLTVAEN